MFNKVTVYRINKQNSSTFLSTSDKNVEPKIKNRIQLTITQKKTELSGINITKHAYALYPDNYTMAIKEIKDELNKWKDTQCSDWKSQQIQDANYPQIDLQV